MKDARDNVIYVGKSISLKKRVKSIYLEMDHIILGHSPMLDL